MNKRIEQLDSMRGIAAFSVLMCHIPWLSLGLSPQGLQLLKYIGFTNGHAAVMLFFVLSGLVLSMPLMNREEIEYIPYIVKRIMRIYLPYLFALIASIILSQLFINDDMKIVKEWTKSWRTSLDVNLFLQHIFFIGNYYTDAFDEPIWSLIHELRISFFFPFVILLVKRIDWKASLLLCVFLSSISGLNNIFEIQRSNGYLSTYFHTFQYLSVFILGSLLAKHKDVLVIFYQNSNIYIKIILYMIFFFTYNMSEIVVSYLQYALGFGFISPYYQIILEYGTSFGAVGFLGIAISSKRVASILMTKPIAFMGKISYSLYLLHMPVLLTLTFLLQGALPLWIIMSLGVLTSILISYFSFIFIEKPCVNLGRKIAMHIKVKFKNGHNLPV